jgi:NMD protein affecting ribosome stability and mRNA decay
MKHCPLCNASSEKVRFYGEFCEDCLAKKLIGELPREVSINTCRDCNRIQFGNDWFPLDDEGMERIMKSRYKGYGVKLVSFHGPIARIRVKDLVSGLQVEKSVDILYKKTLCINCSRRHGGYFETTVQFRGNPERINALSVALQRFLEKNDGYVAKVIDVDNGIDVYVSSRALTTSFLSKKNIKHVDSYTLHTEKQGKRLYRSTYAVKV